MAKFRKKPVVIEAIQFNSDSASYDLLNWINEAQYAVEKPFAEWVNGVLLIPTLEGEMAAQRGDWIIRGVAGEFYPCRDEIFRATYEAVTAKREMGAVIVPDFTIDLGD